MDSVSLNTKIIFVENPTKPLTTTKKEVKTTKEKKKRVITETAKWNKYFVEDIGKEKQEEWLEKLWRQELGELGGESGEPFSPEDISRFHFLRDQMQQKINGYKFQDIQKKKYDIHQFISLHDVLELLSKCKLNCFYCCNPVDIWYEMAREPKQWTLERIDNSFGHNRGNVEISCLSCNLRRRTMYHERYVFTKQMRLIKKEGAPPPSTELQENTL